MGNSDIASNDIPKTKGFTTEARRDTARRSRNQNPSPQRPQRAQRYAGKAKAGNGVSTRNRRKPQRFSWLVLQTKQRKRRFLGLRRFLPENLIPAFAFPAYLCAPCGLCGEW